MIFILKILLLFIHICSSKTNSIEHDLDKKICKYLYIDKTLAKKSNYKTLYTINNFKIDLNLNYVKYIDTNCFDSEQNFFEFYPENQNFVFYGIDLSNNNLDDTQFENLINKNLIFKYNFNWIKYLNISNNNVNNLTSKKSNSYLDNEINLMRDNLYLDRNDPGYLLNRFINLESLIMDNNPRFNVHFSTFFSIFPKLKVLSLNRCSIGISSSKFNAEQSQIYYLGLSSNRINDDFLSSFYKISIEILELASNKITSLASLFENVGKVSSVNLEKNLINSFDASKINQNLSELNLRHNLIQNTTYNRFYSNESRINLKLFGNPLVCDCNSVWLVKEYDDFRRDKRVEINPKYALMNRKKSKSGSRTKDSSSIKLIYKRSIEELSSHLYDLDHNSSELMTRQKRVRVNDSKIVRIIDLDQLSCSFLTSSTYELNNMRENFYREIKSKEFDSLIQYKEKLISTTSPSDFICMYEDHCRRSECDCCDFLHCHCRSICPSKCRCYYDSDMNKNIIDCSNLNILDIENDRPIELATDVRFNSNNLKIIKSRSFFGFSNIKYLYLQNNRISLMEDECFEDLKNTLKIVNLANNEINYLTGDEFKNFTQLEVLILTNNPLKQIDHLDLFSYSFVQNLKLIFMENVNMSSEKLDYLDKFTKMNSKAVLRLNEKIVQLTSTSSSTLLTTKTSITSRKIKAHTQNKEIFKESTPIAFIHDNISNTTYFKDQISALNSPFYLIIFTLMASLFIISVILAVILLFKKTSIEDKKKNYINYVPKLIDHYYHSENYLSDESDSERKKSTKIFRSCHRKSSCSTDSCESSFDGQSNNDSVSVPVSRSIENFYIYVYFNIIDNDYVANHLLPNLKKCITLLPDPKFILKPLKTYYISQADTMSNDFSNDSYSSYYSSIYANKRISSVNAVLLVLSENFYGYKFQLNESYVSIRYKTNPNLSIANPNLNTAYMTLNKTVGNCFKKAFRIHLNESYNYINRSSTTTTKKSSKKSIRDSVYLTNRTESNASSAFFDDMYNTSAYNDRLIEKLEKYFQFICLESNNFSKSNFSYVDYSKR